MKRLPSASTAWLALLLSCAWAIGGASGLLAADGAGARVNRVLKDVQLRIGGGGPQAAKPGALLPDGAVLRTGNDARVEVALPGQGVARLGGKTSFAFGEQARALELAEGLALFQVPRSAPAIKITTGAINVATRGSTGLIERNGKAYVKILVLEGEARVYTKRLGESIVLSAGQLLITSPSALGLPEPVHFAIEHLYKTSLLMNADFAPLGSRPSILRAIQEQKSDPHFVPTNLVIYGRGTLVNLVPPSPTSPPGQSQE